MSVLSFLAIGTTGAGGAPRAAVPAQATEATAPAWEPLGGFVTADPAVVLDPADANAIFTFVRGGEGAPYVGTNGAGTYAVVVGLDYGMYARTLPNGPWTSLGGILTSPPIPVHVDWGMTVISRWLDRSLTMIHLWGPGSPGPGGWTSFLHAGGQLTSAPLAVSAGTNVMIYARGTDNALWRNRFDGFQWYGWTYLGGFVISDTVPVLDGNHLEHTFVIGGDGALYTIVVDVNGAAAGGLGAQSVDGANAPPPGPGVSADEYGVFRR